MAPEQTIPSTIPLVLLDNRFSPLWVDESLSFERISGLTRAYDWYCPDDL